MGKRPVKVKIGKKSPKKGEEEKKELLKYILTNTSIKEKVSRKYTDQNWGKNIGIMWYGEIPQYVF